MIDVSRSQVEAAIGQVIDVYTGKSLVESKSVKRIEVNGSHVELDMVMGYPAKGYQETLKQQLTECVEAIDGVNSVSINFSMEVVAHSVQQGVNMLDGIKNIIAVASGKGGVGKSTTAVNLALALVQEGATVGMLDADIYGPSQPRMLGVNDKPGSKDGKSMEPLESYGIQSMSMGYLVDEESPMVWRGPMVTQALEQLLRETNWRDLDYLIVDLPPGTGDVQLTLSQKIPVSGAVIITTPQDIALLDARKGLKMFEKVNVKVLGIVENMSTHICSQCGHEEHIFGAGGGEQMARDYDVDLLGSLPLDISIRKDADSGKPSVAADPEGAISSIYREIARKVAGKLAVQAKDYSHKFPNIVIQNT